MRNRDDSVFGLIGLATRAGKTITGAQACETAIKNSKPSLVVMAADASDGTKMPIIKLCGYKDVEIREFSSKENLGRCTGKPIRTAIAITDPGFAHRIMELIDGPDTAAVSEKQI